LSLEEEIIDATTDEGKEKIKQLEEQGRAGQMADDPE
jgi:cell division cycle protein 37